MKKSLAIYLAIIATAFHCCCHKTDEGLKFARVENGRFIVGENTPYYFVGTNFWYGAILGSEGEGGDRDRLLRELDYMQNIGINNLRVLVGSEGDQVHSKVVPILQPEPGVYNREILEGLDFLLAEMGKRDMYAVLFLNNSWEWSGGYCQYLQWAGREKYPIPGVDGWGKYMEYVKQYHAAGSDDPCKTLFKDHVKYIISRTNTVTGRKYTEDPAIFSWQIANEPRAFADGNKENFAQWIWEIASLIKSLDPNHMVSTGSEGSMGCEKDIELWERIHSYKEIDYTNIHIWPYNWKWISRDSMAENLETAKRNSADYISMHGEISSRIKKPMVLEEFGFPRDSMRFEAGTPTTLRDSYYEHIFGIVTREAARNGALAGCNFWAWGGFGRPSGVNVFWSKGDDYLGDPAQEEQGLNSVFSDDTTIDIIKQANLRLAGISAIQQAQAGNGSREAILKLLGTAARDSSFLFGQQDFPFYGFDWEGETGRSDINDIVGDYPAVLGCDLGEIELGGEANLDGVRFDDMRAQIAAQYERGGLTTISWHPRNPLTGSDAWDVSDKNTVASILPGGEHHTKFIGWLDKVSEFLCSLKDKDRASIPVIFRPWHEHTGSWFWWGQDLCTTDEYITLWHMTINRLKEKGVTNMAIAYSPTPQNIAGKYMERYPGDGWVDILGVDAYHGGGEKNAVSFRQSLSSSLHLMDSLAAAHGKIIAVTETGSEALPMPEWWTQVLYPAVKDYPATYVLVWRNANCTKKENHFYAPYPGQPSEKDFKIFFDLPTTIFSKDINKFQKEAL